MTLSRFLRDYLYIPLGGNRKGKARRYINLMITMLLGGLWHGAAWTFVFWGFLHGMGLVVNTLWRSLGFKMHWLAARLLTFLFVVMAWVFFRAENFHQALVVLSSMANFGHIGLQEMIKTSLFQLVSLLVTFLAVSFAKNSMEWESSFKLNWVWAALVSVLLVSSTLALNRISKFLYFQF